MRTSDQPAIPRRPLARRWVQFAAISSAVAVAVGVLVATGVFGSSSQPQTVKATSPTQPSSADRHGDVFGPGMAMSCVETYSPATLAKRAFAFDGTVNSIGEPTSAGREVIDPYVPVTFTVHQWFRGGQGDQITIAMLPPHENTSVDNATYTTGSRLLVSGEDRWGASPMDSPIAWACGFTRWYNQADAQSWVQTFR